MDLDFFRRYVPFFLIIIIFVVYLSTICPTVYLGDSGELTVAAFSLGVPHPSGYPIYALIGKLFCLIPIGNIGFRMNLMSVIFSLATIWITYSIIYATTSSVIASLFGSCAMAFTPLLWGQAVFAEVYPLHVFFVALLIRLLIHWDEKRDLKSLVIFAFIAGLSFLNHLQTVMMAPAVFLFILTSDRKRVFNLKTLAIISAFFIFALTVYVYIPIRTHAGAAIHWGDPDNLKNFFEVVSGKAHRSNYVFDKNISAYILRSKEALSVIVKQFGLITLVALWGLIKLPLLRWKLFYLGIIFFDFFYTIFLNMVFIEVTPFNLPTLIVIGILTGIGCSDLIDRCGKAVAKGNAIVTRIEKFACCAIPLIYMASNYNMCNQSKNYTAYEHASNIFRTINFRGTVLVGGDNNLFPIAYARIIERMRDDVFLYDRYNLFFKMPYMGDGAGDYIFHGNWETLQNILEKKIIEKKTHSGVYYSVFNSSLILLPEGYVLIPYGILHNVINNIIETKKHKLVNIWKYYTTESLEDIFYRDYMNREVTAYFHLNKGKFLAMRGGKEAGLERLKLASQIGYNDNLIHVALSVLLVDLGFFDEAKEELEKSLQYSDDPAGVYNNWGYYYTKLGDVANAIDSFNKAIQFNPENPLFYNNLGSILLENGSIHSALKVLKKSLAIDRNQDRILKIIKEHDVADINKE